MLEYKDGKYIAKTAEGTFEIDVPTVRYSVPTMFVDLLRNTTEDNLIENYKEAKKLYQITKDVYKNKDLDANVADEVLPPIMREVLRQESNPFIVEFALRYYMRDYAYAIKERKNLDCANTLFNVLCGPILTLHFSEENNPTLYARAMIAFYEEWGLSDYYRNKNKLGGYDQTLTNISYVKRENETAEYYIKDGRKPEIEKRVGWSKSNIELIDAPATVAEYILKINEKTNVLSDIEIKEYQTVIDIRNFFTKECKPEYSVYKDTADKELQAFKKGSKLKEAYRMSKSNRFYPGMLYTAQRLMSDRMRDDVARHFNYAKVHTLGADLERYEEKSKKIITFILIMLILIFIGWKLLSISGFLGGFIIFLGVTTFLGGSASSFTPNIEISSYLSGKKNKYYDSIGREYNSVYWSGSQANNYFEISPYLLDEHRCEIEQSHLTTNVFGEKAKPTHWY